MDERQIAHEEVVEEIIDDDSEVIIFVTFWFSFKILFYLFTFNFWKFIEVSSFNSFSHFLIPYISKFPL